MARPKKSTNPNAVKVYQVWYETNIGPTFGTRPEAIAFLLKEHNEYEDNPLTMPEFEAEVQSGFDGYGYPDIEEIVLGDTTFYRDR